MDCCQTLQQILIFEHNIFYRARITLGMVSLLFPMYVHAQHNDKSNIIKTECKAAQSVYLHRGETHTGGWRSGC